MGHLWLEHIGYLREERDSSKGVSLSDQWKMGLVDFSGGSVGTRDFGWSEVSWVTNNVCKYRIWCIGKGSI